MNFFTEDIANGYNWQGLERVVARMMGHVGWQDTTVIGGSGDKGCDILGTRIVDGHVQSWVVQSKAVSGDRYIGPPAIKEAIDALSFYEANVAAVVTNGEFSNSARRRQVELGKNGYTLKLWNGAFIRDMISKMDDKHKGFRPLRPYQQKIVNKALSVYDSGGIRVSYIVATGLGKTVIAASIARELWERGLRRILVLCHTVDLASQLESGFWPQISKAVPTSLFSDGLPPKDCDGIAFGLYQSLHNNIVGIEPDRFDAIIVDEAHHALARGFRTCLSYLKPKFLVGMTATPWRGDGQNISSIFGDPIEKVSLVDGMAMGYLARVDYKILCDNVDWENMSSISRKRMSIKDLNKRLFLPQRDEAVITEITKVAKDIATPRIAVFSPSIEHSRRFSNMLTAAGFPCAALSGVDKAERRRRLLAFSTGRYSAVTSVDLMNEGIDIPDVNMLVFLRATHSRRIFVQQLGRGLRIADNKEKVIVLDFVSDVRRMAEMIDMNNEGKYKGLENEVLYLQQGFVSFSDAKVESFVSTWIQDVADLADSDDETKLTFPEGF